MANLQPISVALLDGDTADVDTAKKHPLGTLAKDSSNNIYIYLQGVASTAAKLAVTYDEAHLTALSAANAVGPLAIAMAATVADTYGWYCVYGTTTATANDTTADNVTLFLTAGAGKLDDADVAGDAIIGIWSRSTGAAAGDLTVQLDFPACHDVAIN